MLRICMVALALVIALEGAACSQGLFDSIFGSGGLGVWGGGQPQQPIVQQFNSPLFYGGARSPTQQYGPQQGYQGGQPPAAYAPPVSPGYQQGGMPPQQYTYQSQPGVYSNWQNRQPGVQYSAPQAQQAAPQPQPGPASGPPLRPGQYSPGPQVPDVDDLPPGAVAITTITPQGTTVQYYAPPGETGPPPSVIRNQPRRTRGPTARTSTRQQAPQPRETVVENGSEASGIAMPKPVEMPSGRDPRSGWGGAINR